MKKLHVLGFALFAVMAFSAVMATAALAAPEWLIDEAAVAALTSTEISGELELTDLNTLVGAASVLCNGILDGSVGPAGEDEITEVLNLEGIKISGTKLSGTGLLCERVGTNACEADITSPVTVWPVGLPWHTQLELSGTSFVDIIKPTGASLGYELTCLVLGISLTDECLQASGSSTLTNLVLLPTEPNDVNVVFNEEKGTCTQGGTGSGQLIGEGLLTALEGLEIAVSGE